jgi:flavorubredoxin
LGKEATMAEGKALVLYWTKNGNTEKVARRIHDTLQKAGMMVSIARITQDLAVEYLDYNLIFLGAPVYENLSPKPVLAFLHRNRRREGGKLLPSAPEVPGVAAVPFCTYGGGHTAHHEAEPMLKHIGQYFEHEGIRVVEHIAIVGIFPEAEESYNTEGRFGDIRRRPDEHDLLGVEGRVRGILRRLHRVLPLGKLDLQE